ncbi:hypothetical protein [Oceanospirillum beijerinckii]|nr:hypothetical protein [Oceanospirillum beijerinckii]
MAAVPVTCGTTRLMPGVTRTAKPAAVNTRPIATLWSRAADATEPEPEQ